MRGPAAARTTAPDSKALERVQDMMGPVVCELSVRDLAGEWLADYESVVLTLRLSRHEQRRYDDVRWLLEIVGFWTPEYVRRKLTMLRDARIERMIVCID